MKPKVRFKGFDEDWKEHPLNSFACILSGLTYSPNDVRKKGTLVLRSSNVKNNQIILDDNVYVDSDKVDVENVEIGDIIMVVRNGSKDLIGKHTIILDSMPNTVIGAFMANLRTNNPFFFNTLFSSDAFAKEIDKNAGATINQITNGMFRRMNFYIPKLNEQKAIGEYFRELDGLISETKKEIRKLENVKQASLQKMFPKPGESVPKLRFKGFSEPWKGKRLGDIGVWSKGQSLSKNDLKDKGIYPCIHYGQLFSEKERIYSISTFTNNSPSYLSEGNELLIPDSDVTPDGLGRCCSLQEMNVIIGSGINILKLQSQFYPHFCALNVSVNKNQIIERVTGTTVRHIHAKNLSEIVIMVPSLAEQKAVGEYFRNLDKLISTKKQELEKLKQIKSSCLNLMFV